METCFSSRDARRSHAHPAGSQDLLTKSGTRHQSVVGTKVMRSAQCTFQPCCKKHYTVKMYLSINGTIQVNDFKSQLVQSGLSKELLYRHQLSALISKGKQGRNKTVSRGFGCIYWERFTHLHKMKL